MRRNGDLMKNTAKPGARFDRIIPNNQSSVSIADANTALQSGEWCAEGATVIGDVVLKKTAKLSCLNIKGSLIIEKDA